MRIVTLGLIGAALLLAQDKTQEQRRGKPEKGTETRPLASPATAVLPTVPQGAKEIEPNLYRYTDAQGKTWMYRKTPFGISKWEDKPAPPKPDTGMAPPVAITDLGDSVQFDRPTPFGNSRTIRKKAELTDDEKALIQQEEARRAASAARTRAPDKTQGKTTEKQ